MREDHARTHCSIARLQSLDRRAFVIRGVLELSSPRIAWTQAAPGEPDSSAAPIRRFLAAASCALVALALSAYAVPTTTPSCSTDHNASLWSGPGAPARAKLQADAGSIAGLTVAHLLATSADRDPTAPRFDVHLFEKARPRSGRHQTDRAGRSAGHGGGLNPRQGSRWPRRVSRHAVRGDRGCPSDCSGCEPCRAATTRVCWRCTSRSGRRPGCDRSGSTTPSRCATRRSCAQLAVGAALTAQAVRGRQRAALGSDRIAGVAAIRAVAAGVLLRRRGYRLCVRLRVGVGVVASVARASGGRAARGPSDVAASVVSIAARQRATVRHGARPAVRLRQHLRH